MAIANSQLLGTLPAVQTIFPNTVLGNQLKEVAQLIQLNRSSLGLPRHLFFCSLGGFDTHSQQATAQASLLSQLGNAMAAFNTATDELGVHITIGITSVASPLPYHRSGVVRILAVNAEKRFAQIPDVPTFREAGIPMPVRGSWYGLFAPRGTPPDAITRIEKGVMTAAGDKWVRQSVEALGGEPVFGSQRDFAKVVSEEEAFLASLVKQFPLE